MRRDALQASQRHMAVLAVATSALLLAGSALGVGEALTYLAPTASLFALLLLGVYPGADAYEHALTNRATTSPARPSSSRSQRHVPILLPRGGALLAAGLAGRAPPASLR